MTRAILAAIPSRIAASVEADCAKTIRDEWHRTAQRVFSEMEARRERDRRRAFWIVLAILAALLCATAAGAQERHEWTLGGTRAYVEISAPTRLGCFATVTFRDEPAHSGDETFQLSYDGVTVDFRIDYNGGMPGESLTIDAPYPYVAVPFILEPGEHDVAEAHICDAGVAS